MINILYSLIILPTLVFLAHLTAIFSKRVRKPILLRYSINSKLQNWVTEKYDKNKKVILIHSSSMGEFEHIKPLIVKLNKDFNVHIIVTFFSPSGYENVKVFNGVDLFLYLPFDFKRSWKKFYKISRANILIISKHDVWYNQIKTAKKFGIQTLLVNASLSEKSSRNAFFARLILAPAYKNLDRIFAISKQDAEQFNKSFGCDNIKIAGDTKFDQVLTRKKESANRELLSKDWLGKNSILVLGSLWPQDAEHVLKDMTKLLNQFKNVKIIIVPHQPTEEYIKLFTEYFNDYKYSLLNDNYEKEKTNILVINKIGILADLYKYADIAYVGGSFKQGIHNVMEPAVYGLPVVFGPIHKNSYEAKKILKKGGAIVINNSDEFYLQTQKLLKDEAFRKSVGDNAFNYATKNSGGTEKIVEYVRVILN